MNKFSEMKMRLLALKKSLQDDVDRVNHLLDIVFELDSRRPSMRTADRPAIELLRQIHGSAAFIGVYEREKWSKQIDAVLKTADGS